jgi:hypothetical protein
VLGTGDPPLTLAPDFALEAEMTVPAGMGFKRFGFVSESRTVNDPLEGTP